MNEKELVRQVLGGEKSAVRELYAVVKRRLLDYFMMKTQCKEDAEELVQDTFLHFLDALPLFRWQSTLTTFVMGIARHELMDYWRKKYAKRAIRVVSGLEALSNTLYESRQVSEKVHQGLERAYSQLKPIHVVMLRMKYEEGKSVKEIAALLGWSLKAVEAQLYRSRKAFQKVYVPVEDYF